LQTIHKEIELLIMKVGVLRLVFENYETADSFVGKVERDASVHRLSSLVEEIIVHLLDISYS